jgi:hypothetical protein
LRKAKIFPGRSGLRAIQSEGPTSWNSPIDGSGGRPVT